MNVGVGNGIRMLLKIEEKRQRNEKGRKERKGGGGKKKNGEQTIVNRIYIMFQRIVNIARQYDRVAPCSF